MNNMGPDSPIQLPYQELITRLRIALDSINTKTKAFQIERPMAEETKDKIMSNFEKALLREVQFAENIDYTL